MTGLLIRVFIRNSQNTALPAVRRSYGYLAGATGVAANLLLFTGKLLMGIAVNSIAVMADAFNNLTDTASSVMTLVGFWSSGKPADKEHPFGHGRSEYISALAVSILVIVVGIQFVRSSIERIVSPVTLNYSTMTVLLLTGTILVKLWLCFFYRKIGRTIDSKVMEATALDSMGDVLTTGVVVLSLIAGPYIPFAFDGYVGLAVALLIIWNGWNLVMETLSPLLGEAPAPDFIMELQQRVGAYKGIIGQHDIVVHNYGHGRIVVSMHVEVPVSLGLVGAHELIDDIEKHVSHEMGVDLVLHMDPVDVDDQETMALRARVEALVASLEPGIGFHDFRVIQTGDSKKIVFEIVVPAVLEKETETIVANLTEKVSEMSGGCPVHIQADREYAMYHGTDG